MIKLKIIKKYSKKFSCTRCKKKFPKEYNVFCISEHIGQTSYSSIYCVNCFYMFFLSFWYKSQENILKFKKEKNITMVNNIIKKYTL